MHPRAIETQQVTIMMNRADPNMRNRLNSHKKDARLNRGFTLLELMMSLTILSIVMVMILGALSVGARAWEKGESDSEIINKKRIVLDQMKRQLSSVKKIDVGGVKNLSGFSFEGNSKTIKFVSRYSISYKLKGREVFVTYRIEKEKNGDEKLEISETPSQFWHIEKENEDHFLSALENLKEINFEYLKWNTEEKAYQWKNEWIISEEKSYPEAVRINITDKNQIPNLYTIAGLK